jgi:hypothetical protein
MKRQKGSVSPVDVKTYLKKFEGLDIVQASNSEEESKRETIVLEKWVRHDFPEMGFASYSELDPP